MRRFLVRGAMLIGLPVMLALAAGACESSSTTSSTTPTTPGTSQTETFSGTLKQSGKNSHSFTVSTSGTVSIGLNTVAPLTTMALGVGIGTWDGSTCTAVTKNDNARAGATAISGTITTGNYCALVYDSGNIPSDWTVTYQVQVVHY